jgi:hypothetical protein
MKTAEDFMAKHAGTMVVQISALQAQCAQQDELCKTLYELVMAGEIDDQAKARLMKDAVFHAYYERRRLAA